MKNFRRSAPVPIAAPQLIGNAPIRDAAAARRTAHGRPRRLVKNYISGTVLLLLDDIQDRAALIRFRREKEARGRAGASGIKAIHAGRRAGKGVEVRT
jgi:hypothetical protein